MDQESHPDTDLIPDSPKQRRRCTLAYLNNALVRGVVDSQVRQVVGSITVQAHTPSARANSLIEEAWNRRLDSGLSDTIALGVRHLLIDGGCVPHQIGTISDPFEAEIIPYRKIKTPFERKGQKVRDGFEYGSRNPIAVYVEQEESSYDSVYANGKYDRIELMSHPVLPRLAGQTKGLSWYSAAITRLEMVNRWMMALLASAELHAYVVALVQTNGTDARGMANVGGATLQTSSTSAGDVSKRVMEFARKHRFMYLPGGADYKMIQANAPQVAEFLIWNLRFIARAIGVSFERLTYDLSHTSFSSTKFGDRDDRITVLEHQDDATMDLLFPFNRQIVSGLYLKPDMPGAGVFASDPQKIFSAVRFQLPGRPPVDESKAEKANEMAITNRTASRTRIAADRGDDHEEILDELMREDKAFVEKRKRMYVELGKEESEALDMAISDLNPKAQKPASDPDAEEMEREMQKGKAA